MVKTLFELISKYLVYGSALRQFIRIIRKTIPNYDSLLETKCLESWQRWQELWDKTIQLEHMYRVIKEHGVCSFSQCSRHAGTSDTLEDIQYSRCEGCLSACYRSATCEKDDWTRYRPSCKRPADIMQNDGVPISYHEFQLWQAWTRFYLGVNAQHISNLVTSSDTSAASSRNPILFLDFNATAFIPDPAICVLLTDYLQLTQSTTPPLWKETKLPDGINERWTSAELQTKNKILVVAAFPRKPKYPYTLLIMDFPIKAKILAYVLEGYHAGWREIESYEKFERNIVLYRVESTAALERN